MKIVVLGAGMVGAAIARDLARDRGTEVLAVDADPEALAGLDGDKSIDVMQADLREKGGVSSAVAGSDFVISAVPGFMGFETLRGIIEAGKDVVDIAFFGEDPFLLDELAKKNGVTAVVDCGVAPGLCNIIAGRLYDRLDRTESYACYVGGLPVVRTWPFEYKAPFSPSDVLEEYTRPARLVEHGREVVRPALSEPELLDFPGVGTLEAFNTDGLRSLIRTLPIPFMKEKTMRYPGHAGLMRALRESGFLSDKEIEAAGTRVRPLSLTSRLLFDQWRLEDGEADVTVFQVIVEGTDRDKAVRYAYDLLDRYDPETRTTSMARTTGYTCSIVARQVIAGLFTRKGICPPEYLGSVEGCYEDLLKGYEARSIHLRETLTSPGGSGPE
jgi:saccharopine dehydrogenase-like NADP-dependent oxidoreductase